MPPIRIQTEMSAHLSRTAKNNSEILVAGCASATLSIGDTEVDEHCGCGEIVTFKAVLDQNESTKKENVSRQLIDCYRNTCSDLCLQPASVLDVRESSSLTTEADK